MASVSILDDTEKVGSNKLYRLRLSYFYHPWVKKWCYIFGNHKIRYGGLLSRELMEEFLSIFESPYNGKIYMLSGEEMKKVLLYVGKFQKYGT